MVVDDSLPWYMQSKEPGEHLPRIVSEAISAAADAQNEEALKRVIVQKCQSLSERMKALLGSDVPSKKWTLEEGECQIDVLPDGTYRFEFPHGPNPSRCAWLQIGSDIVEGWFPFDTLANSVLFRTDSHEPLLPQKDQIDVALVTTELILGKIEAFEQAGANKVVADTNGRVEEALEA